MSKTSRALITLEGGAEIEAALAELGDRTTGLLLRQAAQKGADVLAAEAKRLAPRDTGDLADSIEAEAGRIQQGRAQFNIGFGKKEFYGMFVELGTEKMAAQPFLRPAFDSKHEEATEVVGAFLKDALKDVL